MRRPLRPTGAHPIPKYCPRCARRVIRNGSPHATALDLKELEPYRELIAGTLHRNLGTRAVQGGLALAGELLNWQPTHDFTVHQQLCAQMRRLQDHGVTAEMVLTRICEFFAWLQDHPLKVKESRTPSSPWRC